ncbi:hypothetical protein DM475_11360 [Lactobacillus helveticus]|nr:hypothetical protein [Lactobacillus helveticus]PXZ16882.1 hypothetical protein DM475_11360 [Lactobacillus helveticus]
MLIVVNKGDYVNMKTTTGGDIQNGGLYVTHGFAKRAGIKKGDNLKVKTFGSNKQYSFKVKGIIVTETNQGAYIVINY